MLFILLELYSNEELLQSFNNLFNRINDRIGDLYLTIELFSELLLILNDDRYNVNLTL